MPRARSKASAPILSVWVYSGTGPGPTSPWTSCLRRILSEPWPVSSTTATCTRASSRCTGVPTAAPPWRRPRWSTRTSIPRPLTWPSPRLIPPHSMPPAGRATPARSPCPSGPPHPGPCPQIWRSASTRRWTMSSWRARGGPCWWLRRWRKPARGASACPR